MSIGSALRAQARALIGWLLVLAMAVAVLLVIAPARAQAPDLTDEQAAQAEETYSTACATCHGGDGRGGDVPGTDRRAPALAGGEVTVPYLDLVLATGRMPPAGDPFDNRSREVVYSDDERAALVQWMSQEFDIEGEVPTLGAGDVAEGLAVYSRNCAPCHGNSGAGGVAGSGAFTPRLTDRDATVIVEGIRVGPFEMPAFSDDVISDTEASSIAAYLATVDEEQGTPLLNILELNPVMAGAFVAVLAVVMLFSLMFIAGRPARYAASPPAAPATEEPARPEDTPDA